MIVTEDPGRLIERGSPPMVSPPILGGIVLALLTVGTESSYN